MTSPTLRHHPGALTPDTLTTMLAEGGVLADAVVTDVAVAPLGTGQMCDSVRLELTYAGHDVGPATLVAKLPAADDTSRTTAITLQNYAKEVRFYRELADGLDVTVPQVYYADIDHTGGDFILLMADASPAAQGDQLAGCSPEVAADVIDELVGLHAPRWGDPALTELSWLHGDPEAGTAFLGAMLPTWWQGFQARYGTSISDTVARQGAMLFERIVSYLEATRRVDEAATTVTHGDYRLDNLLLQPSGGRVTVVDWQTVGHGHGVGDLAYFVGAGLLAEDRRRHEADLFARYRKGLGASGVTVDDDELWNGYRRFAFSGLIMAVSASMLVEQTERGDAMFLAMAERHALQAEDLSSIDLL